MDPTKAISIPNPADFYSKCSTPALEMFLKWQIPSENIRVIQDIIETRKEKEKSNE